MNDMVWRRPVELCGYGALRTIRRPCDSPNAVCVPLKRLHQLQPRADLRGSDHRLDGLHVVHRRGGCNALARLKVLLCCLNVNFVIESGCADCILLLSQLHRNNRARRQWCLSACVRLSVTNLPKNYVSSDKTGKFLTAILCICAFPGLGLKILHVDLGSLRESSASFLDSDSSGGQVQSVVRLQSSATSAHPVQ